MMNFVVVANMIACDSDKAVTVFNTPPEVDIVSHENGAEFFEGYPVEFRATLSDVNHDLSQLTARWLINGTEVCEPQNPNSDGDSICVATIQTGETEIMVEVRDPENSSSTDLLTFQIIPTNPPTAQIIRPEENGIFYSDHLITFEGIIGDSEDEISELIYTWSSSLDQTLNINTDVQTNGSILSSTYLSEGEHFITLTVEDTTGKTSTASTTITVGGPNNNPTCQIVAPASGIAVPFGDTINFEGIAIDEDIDENLLEVEWTSNKIESVNICQIRHVIL